MPATITQYYLNRISPYTMHVTIVDSTAYFGYQLYVDNILQVGRSTKTFIGNIKPNQKVDILGCSSGEFSENWFSILDDFNGDKVVYYLDAESIGDQLRVYWDNGTGTIDYSTPLDVIDTSLLSADAFSFDDFLHLDTDNFIWMTTDHFVLLKTFDEYGSLRLVITKRLNTGAYKFGIQAWTLGGASPTFEDEVFIVTRPDEHIATITSYNVSTGTLVLAANSTDTGATWNVYATSVNGDYSTLNLEPLITSSTPTITMTGVTDDMEDGTVYLLVRETQNGLEEQNWNWIPFTFVNGNWIENIPGSPDNLQATILQGNIVQLTWGYSSQIRPDGFHIYRVEGSGSINYTTPFLTINRGNSTVYREQVGVITEVADFAVRAFIGSLTDGNTVVVSEYPYDVPTMPPYGAMDSTWQDD